MKQVAWAPSMGRSYLLLAAVCDGMVRILKFFTRKEGSGSSLTASSLLSPSSSKVSGGGVDGGEEEEKEERGGEGSKRGKKRKKKKKKKGGDVGGNSSSSSSSSSSSLSSSTQPFSLYSPPPDPYYTLSEVVDIPVLTPGSDVWRVCWNAAGNNLFVTTDGREVYRIRVRCLPQVLSTHPPPIHSHCHCVLSGYGVG